MRENESRNLYGLNEGVVGWLTVELLMVHNNCCLRKVLVWEV